MTSLEPRHIASLASRAREEHDLAIKNEDHTHLIGSTISYADSELELIAVSGYNDIWRVQSKTLAYKTFILRLPHSDALHPWQLENEASWLRYIKINNPSVRSGTSTPGLFNRVEQVPRGGVHRRCAPQRHLVYLQRRRESQSWPNHIETHR